MNSQKISGNIFYTLIIIVMLISHVVSASPQVHVLFSPELEKLQEMIAAKAVEQLKQIADIYSKSGNGQITINETFYDRKFHRIFVDFKGKMKLSSTVKYLLSNSTLLSGDGLITYDVAFTDISEKDSSSETPVEGQLIIFIDKILTSLAGKTPYLNNVYSNEAETFFKFLNDVDIRSISMALVKTLRDFSSENLENLKKEITKKFDQGGENTSQRIFSLLKNTGKLGAFYVLNLVREMRTSLISDIVTTIGTTLGATIGTLIAPGPGTAIGSSLGGKLFTRYTIEQINLMPVQLTISRLKTYGRLNEESRWKDPWLLDKFGKYQSKLRKMAKEDLDSDLYNTVDVFLNSLEKCNLTERKQLSAVTSDFKKLLEFQYNIKKDRYAERKLKKLIALVKIEN
jgi:hypothetical protein